MIRIDEGQIEALQSVSDENSIAYCRAHIEANAVDLVRDDLDGAISSTLRFCTASDVHQDANRAKIVEAHLRAGSDEPEASALVLLTRDGFSEDERVSAYLAALTGGPRRVTFADLQAMPGDRS